MCDEVEEKIKEIMRKMDSLIEQSYIGNYEELLKLSKVLDDLLNRLQNKSVYVSGIR